MVELSELSYYRYCRITVCYLIGRRSGHRNMVELSPSVELGNGGIPARHENWYWGDTPLTVASNITYLGYPFTSTINSKKVALFYKAKANTAINATIRLIKKEKINSLKVALNLFDSVIKSILLYAAPVWAWDNTDIIDQLQNTFIKNFLNLPRYIPGYIVRLETGRISLTFTTIKLILKYFIRLQKMEENRLPKLCWNRLKEISLMTKKPIGFCKNIMDIINHCGLTWLNYRLNYDDIQIELPNILKIKIEQLLQQDLAKLSLTKTYSNYRLLYDSFIPENYFSCNLSSALVSFIAQIRLMSTMIKENHIYAIKKEDLYCGLCGSQITDEIYHFIAECGDLEGERKKILKSLPRPHLNSIKLIKTLSDKKSWAIELFNFQKASENDDDNIAVPCMIIRYKIISGKFSKKNKSCIRPLIRETFSFIQRPPDLQGLFFGRDLDDDTLESSKTLIYKYFLGVELKRVQEDLVWTLKVGKSPFLKKFVRWVNPTKELKTADFVNLRRSFRLRGLPPEVITRNQQCLKSEPGETSAQVPSTYISLQQPRYPSTFVGDGSEDAQRWLKDYQRMAKFTDGRILCVWPMSYFSWPEQPDNDKSEKSSESSESYIQDVLYLCQLANPLMDDETSPKGMPENRVDDKKRRITARKFERLPNVALVAYEEEDLPSMIRRIIQEEFQKVKIPSTACFLGVEQKAEIKRELALITGKSSLPDPQRSYTRPLPPQRSPENSEVRKTDAWRTPNDQPICFHCGRPGHVVRYCRDRRRIFEEARGRRTNYFPNAEFSRYDGELESELNKRYGTHLLILAAEDRRREETALVASRRSPRAKSRITKRRGYTGGKAADVSEIPPPLITANMKRNCGDLR
ncbi:hypothetical protein LAZ67_4003502 [Cordylochernes scorpioides]|uniref:CCHC-type domain-containing protein n=1 Tax=Cordylochernes scorpioides TaxID=51811 RepID=A0ABY6KDQ5_9ARAC|nr:hypothetical protein LAZ67_4003502 [Cordylochernes scorpioides]